MKSLKSLTIFVYGICVALILVGVVMSIFMYSSFGGMLLICLTLLFTAIYQGWMIEKIYRQFKDNENQ